MHELSLPLNATNHELSLVKNKTETVVVKVGGIHDDVRNMRQDIKSSLRSKGIEEFEKISENIQNESQAIEDIYHRNKT